MKCFFYECCQAPYLTRDFDRLESELSKNLYGQPLVLRTVVPALRAHFELKNPKKALVMSFHGSSGVGMNVFFYSIQLLQLFDNYLFSN